MVLLLDEEIQTDSIDYGYGDDAAAECLMYGYNDETVEPPNEEDGSCHVKATRRSSLKTSDNYQPRRRNSISYTGEIEVQLCDKTIVRRRTSISFTEQNQIKEVEPVLSMSNSPTVSKENLWTTPADYENSQKEVHELLGLVQMVGGCPQKLSKLKHVCLRGLEPHLRHHNASGADDDDDCFLSRFSVLDLQECQRMDGMYCDETLSQVYGELSGTSAARAHQLGLQDYDEVKDEYSRMMNTFQSSSHLKVSRRASM
eukprot:scaffold189_cov188-Amphora_coffeaeformis.AAC.3